MTFPTAFTVIVEHVYPTESYLDTVESLSLTPTIEGFLEYIEDDLWDHFRKRMSVDDLTPLEIEPT